SMQVTFFRLGVLVAILSSGLSWAACSPEVVGPESSSGAAGAAAGGSSPTSSPASSESLGSRVRALSERACAQCGPENEENCGSEQECVFRSLALFETEHCCQNLALEFLKCAAGEDYPDRCNAIDLASLLLMPSDIDVMPTCDSEYEDFANCIYQRGGT